VETYNKNKFSNRVFVISGIVVTIVLIYIAQLFNIQILSPKYQKYAESNAFLKKSIYPSRGLIYDRKGKLLVFNDPTYDIMMVKNEMQGFDTLDFCRTISISKEEFLLLEENMKDRRKNPGYSKYTPQIFLTKIDSIQYNLLQEKLYKFPGIYIQDRSQRKYNYPNMGLILGYVAEIDKNKLDKDPYYVTGDYVGKSGIELSHEEDLRGEKGEEIMLRDARGKVQGRYKNGSMDKTPVAGRDLRLAIDIELQAFGEYLMQNKIGSIVMIEPKTGEILCMVASPAYDPSLLTGKDFSANYKMLLDDPYKPLINRAIAGVYPPGSTFKPSQGAIFLQEGIIQPLTSFPCHHGYPPLRGRPRCHWHPSPLSLVPALATSCNSYFCYGLSGMIGNRQKYGSKSDALNIWKNYLVKMGFGYKTGVDLPSEKRGFIPNPKYYDKMYNKRWNANTIISVSIGQGEILSTPLQIANLAAIVANRGHYYVPHVVRQRSGKSLDTLYTNRHDTGIDAQYYNVIAEGMAQAVSRGTCKETNLAPYSIVCGKTGTAQNSHGEDHSLFMGFAPKDNPQIAIAVIIENGGMGARNAVPIARMMFKKYLKIPFSEGEKRWANALSRRVILPRVYRKNTPAFTTMKPELKPSAEENKTDSLRSTKTEE